MKRTWAVLGCMLLAAGSLRAVDVFYTSPIMLNCVDSSGEALGYDLVVELGAFTAGFTPTLANKGLWLNNWHRASRVLYHAGNQIYSGTFSLSSNSGAFATTQRGWVWVHNRSGEWTLYGNATWTWPNASNIFAPPVYWDLLDADQVVIGSINTGSRDLITASAGGSPGPVMGFAEWASLQNGVSAVMDDDSDGDGVSNFAEFAFGSRADESASLPGNGWLRHDSGGTGYPSVRVFRAGVSGVNYAAQMSEDLINWSDIDLLDVQNDATALWVRDSVALGGRQRVFLRLTAW